MLQSNFSEEREALIGRSMAPLVSELRLLDVEYLISFITLQMYNNIADHIASSSERFFTPGFVTLGNGCDVCVSWASAPRVTLDLVMHLDWAKAYFSIVMCEDYAEVRLNYFSSELSASNGHETTKRLQKTIQDNLI
jgi:hypothetical protein